MFQKQYNYQKDDYETPLLQQNNSIGEISDNRVRYLTIGIVKMVEPLKTVQNQNPVFVIYDSFEQSLFTFDIYTIYEKYIKHGLEYMDTKFGKYKLTQKTIDDIRRIVKSSIEFN